MSEDEIKAYIDLAIKKAISEFKRAGMMKDSGGVVYAEASEVLSHYFATGKNEASVTYAIQSQRFDPYYNVILMYYEKGMTIEQIAEALQVDVSTVVRNKKRLCLAIYNDIM